MSRVSLKRSHMIWLKGLSHSVHGSRVFFWKKTRKRRINVSPSWLGDRSRDFGTVHIHINNYVFFEFFCDEHFFITLGSEKYRKIRPTVGRQPKNDQNQFFLVLHSLKMPSMLYSMRISHTLHIWWFSSVSHRWVRFYHTFSWCRPIVGRLSADNSRGV